jgi:hypothetical protein
MNNVVMTSIVFSKFMDLIMTVMAGGNAVLGTGSQDLILFYFTVFQTFFVKAGLKVSAAAAATEIVGIIG